MLSPGDHGLAQRHLRFDPFRQVDIKPRAKADQTEAFAGEQAVAFAHEGHDAARHEARDLHHGQFAAILHGDHQTVALIVFAGLVERGIEEFARTIDHFFSMRPEIGARFTWQLKTDMNTLTRVSGVSPMPSSGGGAAGSISETTPSAGDTINPARSGTERLGSRKK